MDEARTPAVVRRATLDDVEAVRAVGHGTWPSTYGPLFGDQYVAEGLARWWSTDVTARGITEHRTYVAERGGEVVGCAVVGAPGGETAVRKLYKLYVLPRAQGSDAGRALVAAVIRELPAGTHTLLLDHAMGNHRAHAFYLGQGFTQVGPHGEGVEREMRMQKRILPRQTQQPTRTERRSS